MGKQTQMARNETIDTSDMTRNEFNELFVDVCKICRPEHPYKSQSVYDDMTVEQVDVGYCRRDSNTYARCGPRRGRNIAGYSLDLTYFQNSSFERVLAITTHEVTHIPIGRHNGRRAPMHPPMFWTEMAYHTQCVLDHIDELEDKWGPIDVDAYREEIIQDPNDSMTDKRSETVDDIRARLAKFINEYPVGMH